MRRTSCPRALVPRAQALPNTPISLTHHLLLACTLLLAAVYANAVDVELFERDTTHLGLTVHASDAPTDIALARKLSTLDGVTSAGAADAFSIKLDNETQIAHYLRAARLSGGVYVHLPALCPEQNCTGIRFTVRARRILFGDVDAQDTLAIAPAAASVFFTNEEHPRLQSALYVDPGLSAASATQLRDAVGRIRATYVQIAHRDLAVGIGTIATIARNEADYFGYGGDSLNIVRMTFDNPKNFTDEVMVEAFTETYAHEIGHKLQSPRLFELPQGRLVTEGSADFLKVIVLRRAHARGNSTTPEFVRDAFDECARKRGAAGLLARMAAHEADYREIYDCGMVDYFALMFSQRADADDFLARLTGMLGNPPAAPTSAEDCLLQGPTCTDPVLADMMGDAAHLRSRRDWLLQRVDAFAKTTR